MGAICCRFQFTFLSHCCCRETMKNFILSEIILCVPRSTKAFSFCTATRLEVRERPENPKIFFWDSLTLSWTQKTKKTPLGIPKSSLRIFWTFPKMHRTSSPWPRRVFMKFKVAATRRRELLGNLRKAILMPLTCCAYSDLALNFIIARSLFTSSVCSFHSLKPWDDLFHLFLFMKPTRASYKINCVWCFFLGRSLRCLLRFLIFSYTKIIG